MTGQACRSGGESRSVGENGLLRPADQVALAAITVVALGAIVGWWASHGGLAGRLIEVNQSRCLTARFEVDVNTAATPELMQLPGVGPKLAGRIIESRQSAGPFRQPGDLRRVTGIGQKRLDHIRPYLSPMALEGDATAD
jgi:competence protein ComEA